MNGLWQLHSQHVEYFTLKFHPSNEVRTVNTVTATTSDKRVSTVVVGRASLSWGTSPHNQEEK